MTRLEALCVAHNAAASVAERQGITVTELIQSRTKAAVEGRRILAAELIARMSVAVIADVLGLSKPGVRLLLGPLRPRRVQPKDVWCARNGDDLIPCKSYWAAKNTVIELRKSGIRGAELVRREVGVA